MKRYLVPVLAALLLSLAVSGAAAGDADPRQWEQQTQNGSSESLLQNQNRYCCKWWCQVPALADREQIQQRLRDRSCLDPEPLERVKVGKPVRQRLRDSSCCAEIGEDNLVAGGRGQGQQKRLRVGSCL